MVSAKGKSVCHTSHLLSQRMCEIRHFWLKRVLCLMGGQLGCWQSANNIWESFVELSLSWKSNSCLEVDVRRQSSSVRWKDPGDSCQIFSGLGILVLIVQFECLFYSCKSRGEEEEGEMSRESSMEAYSLSYVKYIDSGNLLYYTGNANQGCVIA